MVQPKCHPMTVTASLTLQGTAGGSLGLVLGAVMLEWPCSNVGGYRQLSEHVSRIWVKSREPWPGLAFLSMTSLGLLTRVCSRNHLVLDLAEIRGPRSEPEQMDLGDGEACLCSQKL